MHPVPALEVKPMCGDKGSSRLILSSFLAMEVLCKSPHLVINCVLKGHLMALPSLFMLRKFTRAHGVLGPELRTKVCFTKSLHRSSPLADLWVMDDIIPSALGGSHWQGCSETIR